VAVGIRSGVPRATLDTDLAVRSTEERSRIVAALVEAGFSLHGEFPHSVSDEADVALLRGDVPDPDEGW